MISIKKSCNQLNHYHFRCRCDQYVWRTSYSPKIRDRGSWWYHPPVVIFPPTLPACPDPVPTWPTTSSIRPPRTVLYPITWRLRPCSEWPILKVSRLRRWSRCIRVPRLPHQLTDESRGSRRILSWFPCWWSIRKHPILIHSMTQWV